MTFVIPLGTPRTHCRTCGADIYWVRTERRPVHLSNGTVLGMTGGKWWMRELNVRGVR